MRTLQAVSRLGRAGVLPAGRLPVSSAPARVRLPQPPMWQRRGAQVGGRLAELPPGVSAERAGVRGGTGRTRMGAGRSRQFGVEPSKQFISLPLSWKVFRSQFLQMQEKAPDTQVKRLCMSAFAVI